MKSHFKYRVKVGKRMNQEKRLDMLIDYLASENPTVDVETRGMDEKIDIFRSLCNVRPPTKVSDEFLRMQDAFLAEWNGSRRITRVEDLQEIERQLYLWQGDITCLAVDAIVNAANSDFIGCMQPNHHCIDNIIHTRAGVQLRLECAEMIREQGRKEAMGKAKITKGYNLPASYVIHTVGPYIDHKGVTPLKEQLLESSYKSCLAVADEKGLSSIAFCCISTGEFNFPNERAAEIAIDSVKKYIAKTDTDIAVIFNVFTDKDAHIYKQLLGQKE